MTSERNRRIKITLNLTPFITFFKDLNEQSDSNNEQSFEDLNFLENDNDVILNSQITDAEILKCINSLKNNKACSNDNIINEYIKSTSDIMLPLYNCFFNLVLELDILPDSWLEGIIKPIYKNKGDPLQPEN